MRRLSKRQLEYSLRDITTQFAGNDAAALIGAYEPLLRYVPDDSLTDTVNQLSMNQVVTEAHVEAYYAIGRALGDAIATRPALLGACATDATTTNDVQCVRTWIEKLGRSFYRRALLEVEVADALEIYDATTINAEGITDVVTSFVLAPQFAYLVERGAATSGTDALTYELSANELASRLSYHFWQSVPDEPLLSAAADGSLLTDEVYRAQVARLFADPKARRASETFFYAWLNLDRIPELTTNIARQDFVNYAGDDLPTPQLRSHMIAEVQDMAAYYTLGNGRLSDLFTNTASFARTDDVAQLYGNVPLWDGVSPPPRHVQRTRVGVLTQAGMLANDQATTRPILRGVYVLKRLLCDGSLGAAQGAGQALPDAELTRMSTRERVTMLTQTPGETCAGCHNLINPLGFAREDFDGLGRYREQEPIYSGETGEVVATVDVNAASEVAFDGGAKTVIDGSAALGEHLATSKAVQACFVRNYVRFTFGRTDNDAADGCMMKTLNDELESGATLAEVAKSVALTPEFRRIRKEDAPEEAL